MRDGIQCCLLSHLLAFSKISPTFMCQIWTVWSEAATRDGRGLNCQATATPTAGWELETSAAPVPECVKWSSSWVALCRSSCMKHPRNEAEPSVCITDCALMGHDNKPLSWFKTTRNSLTRAEIPESIRQEWIRWTFPLRSCALSLQDHRVYLQLLQRDGLSSWEGRQVMALSSEYQRLGNRHSFCINEFGTLLLFFGRECVILCS